MTEPTDKADEPCFVIASRQEEDAAAIRAQLEGYDVFVKAGASGIFEAYEEGRLHWEGRRRIVYIHDDVEIRKRSLFLEALCNLKPGTHGVCGSAHKKALTGGPWWTMGPLAGTVVQIYEPEKRTKRFVFNSPEKSVWVAWLDGLCLVTVDQTWTWQVDGSPKIWHGYDWLACLRTRDAGGECRTIAQPKGALLAHRGYGRMEDYTKAMKLLRVMTLPIGKASWEENSRSS